MSGHRMQHDTAVAGWDVPDPGDAGAISHTTPGVCKLITVGAAETRTLAAPVRPGIMLTLSFATDGGDCTITVASPYQQGGDNTLLCEDIGDAITLISCWATATTLEWRTMFNDGFTETTVA